MLKLTCAQAGRFLLYKHGLFDERRFFGKQGVLDFVRQVGCVQFDPIDVCGKNAELVLQSRVAGFTKSLLYELLYTDRALVDCFDKNLSILPVEDYPYFAADRAAFLSMGRSRAEVNAVCGMVKEHIRKNGPVCSADLRKVGVNRTVDWYWAATSLSRAALETLYFRGELAVSGKKGAVKYYDLAEHCLPPHILAARDPLPSMEDHLAWRVLRRIGSVGLLWNKPSDAWLNIPSFRTAERKTVFERLLAERSIVPVYVEGVGLLYSLASDSMHLERFTAERQAEGNTDTQTGFRGNEPRCELLAPLDNLLWDRNLVRALWGFDYKWEIYTPAAKRRHGYYVLPLLYGDRFAGRVEPVADKKAGVLTVRNVWYEDGFAPDADFNRAFTACLERFASFNGCSRVTFI